MGNGIGKRFIEMGFALRPKKKILVGLIVLIERHHCHQCIARQSLLHYELAPLASGALIAL